MCRNKIVISNTVKQYARVNCRLTVFGRTVKLYTQKITPQWIFRTIPVHRTKVFQIVVRKILNLEARFDLGSGIIFTVTER